MARRRKHEDEHENLERWLVSYADFITLLFAFFVVMYAISSVNEGKYRVLSDSLVNAFRSVEVVASGQIVDMQTRASVVPRPPNPGKDPKVEEQRRQTRDKMKNIAQDIFQVLAPLVQQGKVRVVETNRGVTIEISDSILFAPGQALLENASSKALRMVAEVLAPTDFPVTIEGHTDNVPINTVQFPSNWELSAVRATTVLRLFADTGVAASRLTAIGYGDTRPVENNQTPENRARNRRVSILIDSLLPEAPPAAAADSDAAPQLAPPIPAPTKPALPAKPAGRPADAAF